MLKRGPRTKDNEAGTTVSKDEAEALPRPPAETCSIIWIGVVVAVL